MKPTIRVSIGGIAFNLDEDAYALLQEYLERLRRHFASSEERNEIINDIEMRLCELLQMRIATPDSVVSLDDARNITDIMGNPHDFGDSSLPDDQQPAQQPKAETKESGKWSRRRLFRDMDRRIIGGVCSGLGHYFRIDPVLVRILVAIVFVIACIVEGGAVAAVLGAYIVLWIVMPRALTFDDKMAMTGADPSIYHVANRQAFAPQPYRGSVLGSLIRGFFKFVGGLVAVCLALALTISVGALIWAYFDTSELYLRNYLTLVGWDTFSIKFWLAICILTPLLIICYVLIKLLTASRFKAYNFGIIALGVVLWFVSIGYFSLRGMSLAWNDNRAVERIEPVAIDTKARTLILKLDDSYNDANDQPINRRLRYRTNENGTHEVCIIPQFRYDVDSTLTNYKVEIKQRHMGHNRRGWKNKRAFQGDKPLTYTVSDSVVSLSPTWHSNHNPWSMEDYEIIIHHPAGTEVEVDYSMLTWLNM